MQIDNLKAIWKQQNSQQVTERVLSTLEIKAMITKKSETIIAKAKRTIKRKVCFASILGGVVMFLAILNYFDSTDKLHLFDLLTKSQYSVMIFLMGAITFGYGMYLSFIYYQILGLERSSAPLKSTLQRTITMIKKVVRVGVYSDAVGVPVAACFIIYIYLFRDQSLLPDMRVLFLIPIAAVIYRFVRKRMFKNELSKYGSYIDSLEGCVDQLENNRNM